MDKKEIEAFLGEDWLSVKELIASSLATDVALLARTNAQILEHSGKQMRPMISLLMARACNGGEINGDTIKFAATTELLHNATLLHDDVVDDSGERRGGPTVNALLGGHASVLIGDFWLVKAMDTMIDGGERVSEAGRVFSKTLSDLAEGEMLQLQKASTADTSMEDYLKIIFSKTASLFKASCECAALSVGAPEDMVSAAREYGLSLGMAFQIRDDILDYSGKDLGKPVGKDLMEQKITLPLLGAFSAVDEEKEREVRGMVRDIHRHPEYVEQINGFVASYGGVGYAMEILKEYAGKALSALDALPDSQEKEYLKLLADYSVYRQI